MNLTARFSILFLILIFLIPLFSACDLLNDIFGTEEMLDAPNIDRGDISRDYATWDIEVWWNWVDGAENFVLYRAAPDDGSGFVEIFWGNQDRYSDGGRGLPNEALSPGHTYQYKVQAHADGPGIGPFSQVLTVILPAFMPPQNVTAELTVENSVMVDWDPVENADQYMVYRSKDSDGYYNLIDTMESTETFYLDLYPDPSTIYYYKVVAHSHGYGDTDYSETAYVGIGLINPPETVSATEGGTKVTITWSGIIAVVDDYRVYRSEGDPANLDSYEFVSDWINISTYDDTTAVYGVQYYYRVSARFGDAEGPLSSYTSGYTGTLGSPPDAPQNVQADDAPNTGNLYLIVTWDASPGAESYNIYRLASSLDSDPEDTSQYTLVGSKDSGGMSLYYEDLYHTKNLEYYYRVTAVTSAVGFGESDFSGYDTGYCGTPTAPSTPPQAVTATEGEYSNAIEITWQPVADAAWYQVYHHGGNSSFIDDTMVISDWITDTSFVHMIPGVDDEFYKVKAKHENGGITSFSDPATGWTSSSAPVYGVVSTSSVSGTISVDSAGLASVNIILTEVGTTVDSTVTNASGSYTFADVPDGDYVLTPSLTGYSFTPVSQSFTVAGSNISNVDFAGEQFSLISYTWSDLGSNLLTDPGDLGFSDYVIDIAYDTGSPYVGYFRHDSPDDFAGAMEWTGAAWNGVAGSPLGALPPLETGANDHVSMAAGSGRLFLAAIDSTSVVIHEAESSSWSANLAGSHFGDGTHDDRPSRLDLAVMEGELYAAQVPDDEVQGVTNVKVSRYDETGGTWQHVGGDSETGLITTSNEVWEIMLKNIGGTLYLAYTEDRNDDGFNEWFTIRHWTGSNWATDLEWGQDYLGSFDFALVGGTLYFTCSSNYYSQWPGGTFQVESTSAAVSISENAGDSLSTDGSENLIMLHKKLEIISGDPVVLKNDPMISIYDGSSWSEVSGDYSDMADPGAICTDVNNLYYVYGVKSSIPENGRPGILKVSRLSPE